MSFVFFALIIASGLTALTILAVAFQKNPMLVILTAGVEIFIAWEIPREPALGSAIGFNLYATDVISIIMLVVALINYRQLAANFGPLLVPWIAFGLVLAVSLLSGAAVFGLGTATNEARSFLQLYAGLTWAASVNWDKNGGAYALYRPALILGWSLTLLACFHAAVYGINGADSVVNLDGTESVTGRVLVSGQAMALTLCAGSVVAWWAAKRTRVAAFSASIFGVVVVISQHRSVWIAALVGIASVFVFGPWKSKIRMLAVMSIASIAGILLAGSGALNSILVQFTQALSDDRSLNARTFDWPQLIDQSFRLGPGAVLVGQPMGSGYVRTEPNGLIATFMPHNWYVSIFLRTGILGSIFFWLPFIWSLFLAMRNRKHLHILFTVVVVLTYSGAYSMESYLYFFIGWAVILAIQKRSQGTNTTEIERTPVDKSLRAIRHADLRPAGGQ